MVVGNMVVNLIKLALVALYAISICVDTVNGIATSVVSFAKLRAVVDSVHMAPIGYLLLPGLVMMFHAEPASGTVMDSLACPELPTLICLDEPDLHNWVSKIVCVSHGEDGIMPVHLKDDVLSSGCNCYGPSCSQPPMVTESPNPLQSSPASLSASSGNLAQMGPNSGTELSLSTNHCFGEPLNVTAGWCTEDTVVPASMTSPLGEGKSHTSPAARMPAQVLGGVVAIGSDLAASAVPSKTGLSKRRKSEFTTMIPTKPCPYPKKYCSVDGCGDGFVCCGAFCIPYYLAQRCRIPVMESLKTTREANHLLPRLGLGSPNNMPTEQADLDFAVFVVPSEAFTTTLMPKATNRDALDAATTATSSDNDLPGAESYDTTVTQSLTAYLVPQQGQYASVSMPSPSVGSFSVPVVDNVYVNIDAATSDNTSTVQVCFNTTVAVNPTSSNAAATMPSIVNPIPATLCFDSANSSSVPCPTTVQVTLNGSTEAPGSAVATVPVSYGNASLSTSVASSTSNSATAGNSTTAIAPTTTNMTLTALVTSGSSIDSSGTLVCFNTANQDIGPCTASSSLSSAMAFNGTSMTIVAGAGRRVSVAEPASHAIALFIAALLF